MWSKVFAVLVLWLVARAGACPAADSAYETIRSVEYATRGDQSLRADVYLPRGQGPFPGVLCIHGGAWAAGNKNQVATIAETLAENGYTAVAISYRLAPNHKFPAQFDDCREALDWMRRNAGKYKIDPDRLGAWGYSAGGHLAALLATSGADIKTPSGETATTATSGKAALAPRSTPPKAVVAGGAPCDFRSIPLEVPTLAYWLGGTRRELPEVYDKASPLAHVTRDVPPILFYHGEKDSLVPIVQPKAMSELLKKSGVVSEVHIVPQAGHVAAFLNRDAMLHGVAFLDKHLKGKPTAKPETPGR